MKELVFLIGALICMLIMLFTATNLDKSEKIKQLRDSVETYRKSYLECNGDHKRTNQFYDSLGVK